jgi:hypothetical protein
MYLENEISQNENLKVNAPTSSLAKDIEYFNE